MKLYREDDAECREDIAAFRRLVAEFGLQPWQPSPERAPWHVQARVGPAEVLVNFWPHNGKAQRDGCMSVMGESAIRDLLGEAASEPAGADVLFDT